MPTAPQLGRVVCDECAAWHRIQLHHESLSMGKTVLLHCSMCNRETRHTITRDRSIPAAVS